MQRQVRIMVNPTLQLPKKELENFCRRWKVAELSVFGSAIRDDFGPDSDVDLLVSFLPEAQWSLFDHIQMEEELKELLARDVDLVSRRAIEQSKNWIGRKSILQHQEVIYAAG